MNYRSFYITPYRLTKNPYLWRSVGLMTSVKSDQKITMPEPTYKWLRSGSPPNWSTLSLENAVMCLKYGSYLEYRWQENIPFSEKILDKIIEDTDPNQRLVKMSLGCQFTKEETITSFIENKFISAAAKVSVEATSATPWYSSPDYNNVVNWSGWIASNPGLKTYQLEMMFKALPAKISPIRQFLGKVKLGIVPDYILKDFLDKSLSNTDPYDYHQLPLLKEGISRKLLVRVDPFTETVKSQPRPVFTKLVVVTDPIVVQA